MEFVNKWVNHFEEYKKSLEPFTLEYAEKITGVPASTLIDGGAMRLRRPMGFAFCLRWG